MIAAEEFARVAEQLKRKRWASPSPHPARRSTAARCTKMRRLVRELRPKRTLLVGMSHRFEHYAANEELSLLKAESHGQLDVQLAFDGQRIEVAAA